MITKGAQGVMAVELVPAMVGGCRDLQCPADIGHALALVEELLSGAEPADDLS